MSWKPATEPSRLSLWMPGWVPPWLLGLIRWAVKLGLVSFALLVAVGLFYFYLSWQYDMREVAKIP